MSGSQWIWIFIIFVTINRIGIIYDTIIITIWGSPIKPEIVPEGVVYTGIIPVKGLRSSRIVPDKIIVADDGVGWKIEAYSVVAVIADGVVADGVGGRISQDYPSSAVIADGIVADGDVGRIPQGYSVFVIAADGIIEDIQGLTENSASLR